MHVCVCVVCALQGGGGRELVFDISEVLSIFPSDKERSEIIHKYFDLWDSIQKKKNDPPETRKNNQNFFLVSRKHNWKIRRYKPAKPVRSHQV